MNKKGFVFMETIITIVILSSSLLLIYSSFKNLLVKQKSRIYYDDVVYTYRTYYIEKVLNNYNIYEDLENIDYLKFDLNNYNDDFIKNLLYDFEVNDIIFLKKDKLNNLKECFKNKECNDINPELRKYISTISFDFDCSNILIIEYKICNKDNCQNFYSWVGA